MLSLDIWLIEELIDLCIQDNLNISQVERSGENGMLKKPCSEGKILVEAMEACFSSNP